MTYQLDMFTPSTAMTRPLTGAQLASRAAQQAADHAEERNHDWIEKAYRALRDFIALHPNKEFTTEEVRAAAINVPPPPDDRAWGAIILRAKRAGLVRSIGYRITQNAIAHHRPVTVWIAIP